MVVSEVWARHFDGNNLERNCIIRRGLNLQEALSKISSFIVNV